MNIFQITMNYPGGGGTAWLYFESAETDANKIKAHAIREVKADWRKQTSGPRPLLGGHVEPNRTIYIKEWDKSAGYGGQKKRGGISLKAQWR